MTPKRGILNEGVYSRVAKCCGYQCLFSFFLDALASLKTMLDIKSVTHVFTISRLQRIRECCRVLQSITECYKVLRVL